MLNYSQILHMLKVEFDRAKRYETPLSCMVLQIDRLETLADIHGFRARQFIFDNVTRMLNVETRSCDFVGRYGDSRIAVILPHTDMAGAETLARRVTDRLADYEFEVDGKPLRVTVSIGIASYFRRSSLFYDAVIKAAENALNDVMAEAGKGIGVDPKSRELFQAD